LKIHLSEKREFEILNIRFCARERELRSHIIAIKKKRTNVERERSVRGGSVRDEGVELVPKESERERSVDGFRGTRL
jgi:hypothetical protein